MNCYEILVRTVGKNVHPRTLQYLETIGAYYFSSAEFADWVYRKYICTLSSEEDLTAFALSVGDGDSVSFHLMNNNSIEYYKSRGYLK